MRTTIELTDEQHRALSALAQRRGQRGFSALVQEAVEAYLQDLGTDEVDLLLQLRGSITDAEAAEMRTRIRESRAVWRTS